MSTRRVTLDNQEKTLTTNAGLWLHKFIKQQSKEDKESRHRHLRQVAGIRMPDDYARWFERWRQTLQDFGAECHEAKVKGRMAVGLGAEGILETSVALHHTYGVPYIPGSALKGLTARFARDYLGSDWQPQAEMHAYRTVFGDTETAGYITFFDALPFPQGAALTPDVLTVHHKGYYGNDPSAPPADWDDPNPVPFLSATGKYLIALYGPPVWVGATFEILKQALLHLGVGAKTSSGYGRMQLASAPSVDPDRTEADRLIMGIEAIKPSEVAGRIHAFYQEWRDLEISPAEKRRVAEAIVAKVKEAGREKQSREKSWYREVLDFLR